MDAYCLTCGRPAVDQVPGLDPAHPRVLCRYTERVGPRATTHGHGWTAGTIDPDQAAAWAERARVARGERDHRLGRHAGKLYRQCPGCQPMIAHRRHLRDRRTVDGCELCALAHDRAAPVRHAR
jgi:hypothetical protein